MKYILPTLALITACSTTQADQNADIAHVEALGQFNITATTGTQRITTHIDGCLISIDTTATSGDRAGQLDHRDSFEFGAVAFEDDGATPPSYVISIIPGISLADDPSVPISINYRGETDDSMIRTVPVWKDPRDPYVDGPTINGVDHVLGPRKSGSFGLDGLHQQPAADAFVFALLAYGERYCQAGTS